MFFAAFTSLSVVKEHLLHLNILLNPIFVIVPHLEHVFVVYASLTSRIIRA